jgi:hypothetical protein
LRFYTNAGTICTASALRGGAPRRLNLDMGHEP